jgi:hypothetical protein
MNRPDYPYPATGISKQSNTGGFQMNDQSSRHTRQVSHDSVTLSGWGSIQGNDTCGIVGSVDFGLTFVELPIVLLTFLGGEKADAPPTSISFFPGVDVGNPKVWTAAPRHISESGFEVSMSRNPGIFFSNHYYGYSWIAIGPVA